MIEECWFSFLSGLPFIGSSCLFSTLSRGMSPDLSTRSKVSYCLLNTSSSILDSSAKFLSSYFLALFSSGSSLKRTTLFLGLQGICSLTVVMMSLLSSLFITTRGFRSCLTGIEGCCAVLYAFIELPFLVLLFPKHSIFGSSCFYI